MRGVKYASDDERRAAKLESQRRYRERYPERRAEASRRWYEANKSDMLAKAKSRYSPAEKTAAYRKRVYGLTAEAFDWMLEQQGGTCATCDKPAVAVDHDHEDGHVRGLLCHGCNTEIGRIENDRLRRRRCENYANRA